MFAVIQLSAVPEHVHGYVSRFLSEVSSGLYVGVISRNVKEQLWERLSAVTGEGSAVLIYNDSSREQGFGIEMSGRQACKTLDFDGLTLFASRPGRINENRASGR
ncbi:CRISPR-associated protein Cas2 [Actinobaculum suis]|uniref:type I-E CRISPR-associated endoribonuclease Cas2e n=1 Tax=Actinobaculum suis TaxID=1657 RepID=UPI00066FEB1D|nr:type I-E CRISPR-associated endoribonuclease Cas2e [Actinobaculum suis]KMY23349.1 CRISPR-associated protein Cas2 [Actinobaculum suis]